MKGNICLYGNNCKNIILINIKLFLHRKDWKMEKKNFFLDKTDVRLLQ